MIEKLLLPAGLAFIMFAIGLTLHVTDFTKVFRSARAVLLGLFCQIVLLPLVAFTLLSAWPIDPVLAVGVMILAASPGGITSNLLTHFARGDTALSISLTAITSLLGMITVPAIVTFAAAHFSDIQTPAQMPVWKMIIGVFLVSTLPVIIGMAINHMRPKLAEKIEVVARPLSVAVFALIVIGAFASQWTAMMENLPVIGALMVALNVAIMAVGYGLAFKAGLGRPAAKAISLEGGLQNGALGIFVATTLIGNATLAIPSITYALVMNVTAAVFIVVAQYAAMARERA